MKANFLAAIAMTCLATVSIANAQAPVAIGEAHSTDTLGPNTQQTVTVNSDGSIHAVLQDGVVATTIDMQLSGSNVTLIKRDKWGVTTSMIDLEAGAKFVDKNPAVVAIAEHGLNTLQAMRIAHYSVRYSVSPMTAGGPCASEAQSMINAGYAAIMACSGGTSLGCLLATNDYNKAVEAYNACINKMYPGTT
ncbi:MAG: hypothetical protein JSR56_00050 [Proteobacteria bacterium]|nr:hypothetical protein [Pseudomonadota bacterium]